MRAVSECDLCPGITAEVKDVGIFELLLVAICGNTKHDNGITGSDQLPIHDNVLQCDTSRPGLYDIQEA
ncbi:hypothetical protein D3C81_2039290 [compost metagenome]